MVAVEEAGANTMAAAEELVAEEVGEKKPTEPTDTPILVAEAEVLTGLAAAELLLLSMKLNGLLFPHP